jgi:hypothetical protein
MQKKLITILSTVLILCIFTSAMSDILSAGAPIGSTGAPGELTCAKSGCHEGNNGANNLNTGTALLTIQSDKSLDNYIPNELYLITVSIEEPLIERFGFSLTVLDEDNKKAGEIMLTEPNRTQIMQGVNNFAHREYITYQTLGTYPTEPGKASWTFIWKAPDSDMGKINFYAAAVSANNDGTDKGDGVYTQTKLSNPTPVGLLDNMTKHNSFSIFPNPANDFIFIKSNETSVNTFNVRLISLNGNEVYAQTQQSFHNNITQIDISGFQKGFYYVLLESEGIEHYSKIIIW